MSLVWSIVGAIIGVALGATIAEGSTTALGLFTGAVCGYLISRVSALSAQTRQIEERLAKLGKATAAERDPQPAIYATQETALDLRSIAVPLPPNPVDSASFDLDMVDTPAPPPAPWPAPWPVLNIVDVPHPIHRNEAEQPGSDPASRAIGWIKAWFTEGNVPVKVGMLVLFAGVAALLKYAADEGWFTLPIELRLAGVAAASVAALVFAWRQRESRRSFSLSLQGGAMGLLLLTVFAAFRLYHLLPAGAAFALMLVLVAGICVMAVVQDALALAVLGILAGFAAPILISTGSGNHVALFSYYALLNAGILVIAWVRPWRALNLLGFFFTYAIATAWGVLSYKHEQFASTEPFLLLFFAFYLAIPILYAIKRSPERRDFIDGTLVFGNPLVAFALQAALLEGERMPLALSAIALGLIYIVLAWILIRRLRVLGESFAILALGFSTLAIPLALSARTSGCIFALEGAALIWLGMRQQRRLPRWTGLLLQLFAAGAFGIAFDVREPDAIPIANGAFVGAMLVAGAAMVSAWLYHRAKASSGLSMMLYPWGLLWWLGTWLVEIDRFVANAEVGAAVLTLLAVTAWLAAEAERQWRRPDLRWTVAVLLWLALPLSLLIAADGQVFAGWNLAAYAAFAVFGWRSLICLRDNETLAQTAAHLGWLWTWTVAAGLSLRQIGVSSDFGAGWVLSLIGLPLLLMHTLALQRPDWISPPLSAPFPRYRPTLLGSQAVVLGILLLCSLVQAGASAPLPFIPIVNPLELFQIACLITFVHWARDGDAPDLIRVNRSAILAAGGFVVISAATLRAVHHLGDISWNGSLLTASLSQTCLAVVWSVLGVAGWVIGSRRGNRPLWLASALLMAVVLIKLLLIDRQHLGNLFGIASFIAYGLLCTLVGYLAPAPPRTSTEAELA